MREQRNVVPGAAATVGERGDCLSGCLLHVAAIFCSDVGSFCERLRVFGGQASVYMDSTGPWTLAFV